MRISDWSSDVCSSDLGTAEEIYQEAEGAKKCLHYWIEGGRAEVYQIDASRQPLAQIAFRVLNQEIDFVAAASQARDDVQHHLFGAKPGPYGVDVERQWPGRGHRRRAIQTSFTLRRSCRFGGRDLSTACRDRKSTRLNSSHS